MTIKKNILYFILVLLLAFSPLFSQNQPNNQNEKYQRIEKFLYGYYTDDLQIAEVIVKIDNEIVAVSGTPDFRNKKKAIGQIVLAISGAGMAAPWTSDIFFTFQIEGLPLGFIEVPTRKAMLASEGKMSPKDFISSFIATQLSIPFDFPKDLLVPILKSAEIWENSSIVEGIGAEIEELLSVNAEGFIPEFLESAYVKAEPDDGSRPCIAGVIDFEKEEEAMDFLVLNNKESPNFLIQRIGSIVYIIEGSEEVIKKSKATLNPKPGKKVKVKKSGVIKNLNTRKYLIIIMGFFVLFIIILIIFILSGRKSNKSVNDMYVKNRENSLEKIYPDKNFSVPAASLIITSPDDMNKSFQFTKEVTTIGRDGGRENDILIFDDTVSRQQATIIYDFDKDQFLIKNESRSNPTILNNEIISVARVLQNNSKLKMGNIKFVFKKDK